MSIKRRSDQYLYAKLNPQTVCNKRAYLEQGLPGVELVVVLLDELVLLGDLLPKLERVLLQDQLGLVRVDQLTFLVEVGLQLAGKVHELAHVLFLVQEKKKRN